MSVISISGLTLGYFTLPSASAAGLPGSFLTRNAVWSVRTRPSDTVLASSERSSAEVKVGILRRYGSPPDVCAVESALAMFSEIRRMRPACARRPDVAMLIDLAKSLPSLDIVRSLYPRASAFADRGLDEAKAAAVERGRRRIVHLVGGDLQHLVLEIDGIARGPGLEAALAAVMVKGLRSPARRGDVAGAGAHHRERTHGAADARSLLVEFRLDQVARPEVRRRRIGDVFGEHPLPLLMPLHLGAQRREHRQIVNGHRPLAPPLPQGGTPEVGRMCRSYGLQRVKNRAGRAGLARESAELRQSKRIFATKTALTSTGQSNPVGQKSFWSKRFLVYYLGWLQVFDVVD